MARWINMLQSKHCQSNYLWYQMIRSTEYVKNCYNLRPSYRLGLRSIQKNTSLKQCFVYLIKIIY